MMTITITPNPAFLKKFPSKVRKVWHDALLNTDAKQAREGMLFKNQYGSYQCCLMVAHLAFGGSTKGYTKYSLPQYGSPVLETFGQANPYIGLEDGFPISASRLNDEYKLSFAEIAQLVYPNSHLYGRVSFQKEV